MRTNLWLVCGMLACFSVAAQQATNSPSASSPSAPGGQAGQAEGAPHADAAQAAKRPSLKPPRTTPLKPGAAVVAVNRVNVRGQARLRSEVVARLERGAQVTVLEEIALQESAPDEPSAWAKILLPSDTKVWVHSMFIDADTKQVKPRRLNIRSGPGENYSVLGTLERGQVVQDGRVKDEWLEIEAPKTAFAFVAAQYLSQEASLLAGGPSTETAQETSPTVEQPAEATTPPPAPPQDTNITTTAVAPETPVAPETTNTVSEPPTIAEAPTEPPAVTPEQPATNEVANAAEPITEPGTTNEVATASDSTGESAEEPPPPPRIVQREGVVRGSASIQAPTRFELYSPETRKVINYLYIDAADLDLARYKGLRIIVSGEEGLDERWRLTPVLTIQSIKVLE